VPKNRHENNFFKESNMKVDETLVFKLSCLETGMKKMIKLR